MYQIKYAKNNKEYISREYSMDEFNELEKELQLIAKENKYHDVVIFSDGEIHPHSDKIYSRIKKKQFLIECSMWGQVILFGIISIYIWIISL